MHGFRAVPTVHNAAPWYRWALPWHHRLMESGWRFPGERHEGQATANIRGWSSEGTGREVVGG